MVRYIIGSKEAGDFPYRERSPKSEDRASERFWLGKTTILSLGKKGSPREGCMAKH